jgi:hypothetical protein
MFVGWFDWLGTSDRSAKASRKSERKLGAGGAFVYVTPFMYFERYNIMPSFIDVFSRSQKSWRRGEGCPAICYNDREVPEGHDRHDELIIVFWWGLQVCRALRHGGRRDPRNAMLNTSSVVHAGGESCYCCLSFRC